MKKKKVTKLSDIIDLSNPNLKIVVCDFPNARTKNRFQEQIKKERKEGKDYNF